MSALAYHSDPAPAPRRARKVHVIRGQFYVSDDPDVVLSTILGSCVAACLVDRTAGVGGMNHFLLPGDGGSEGLSYGVNAMELLVNGILQRGGRRERLEAKLFGGGRVLNQVSDIGRGNAEFALRFLRDEGVRCVGTSLGGDHARRVEFWAASGRARQLLLTDTRSVAEAELSAPPPPPAVADDDVELF